MWYHGIEEVQPMDREGEPAVAESADSEVEPALGVALVVSALGVAGGPEGVVLVAVAHHPAQVARVEPAVEEDQRLAGLAELEAALLRYLCLVARRRNVFHFKTVVIKFITLAPP